MTKLNIADLQLCWADGPVKPPQDENSQKFAVAAPSGGKPIVTIDQKSQSLDFLSACTLCRSGWDMTLYKTSADYYRVFGTGMAYRQLAVRHGPWSRRDRVELLVSPSITAHPPEPMSFMLGVIGLHRILLQHGKGVLHASYIDRGGQAVLFTAPSGTGKSTQAELWRQHAGATVINGDRVAVGQRGGVWHAYGYPACGSSNICLNRTLPLQAIVVLRQGPQNRVEPLGPAAAARSLFTATQMFAWDSDEVNAAIGLASALAAAVPVVLLTCRPDADAVDTLRRYLDERCQ